MANLVQEIQERITGPTKIEVSEVIHATLGKDTRRCV